MKNKNDNMYKPDIKYMKIPNVCFSLSGKDGKREKEFSKQRKERGFDDSETWSLTDTISNFTIPRLKRLREVTNGCPVTLKHDEWLCIIDKMILSLELVTRDAGSRDWTDSDELAVNEGLDLFRKYFLNLWW